MRRSPVCRLLTQSGSQPPANGASDRVPIPAIHPASDIGGSDASWVDRAVRGDVVDLAARSPHIHQLFVVQAAQGGAQHLALAAFLKPNPISPEEAGDASRRYCGLSR